MPPFNPPRSVQIRGAVGCEEIGENRTGWKALDERLVERGPHRDPVLDETRTALGGPEVDV